MTRDQFHDEVKCNPNYLGWHNAHELADKLFDEVEIDTTCNGCKYQPKEGENYPEVCGTCSRWYGDKYVSEPLIIENKLKEIETYEL